MRGGVEQPAPGGLHAGEGGFRLMLFSVWQEMKDALVYQESKEGGRKVENSEGSEWPWG